MLRFLCFMVVLVVYVIPSHAQQVDWLEQKRKKYGIVNTNLNALPFETLNPFLIADQQGLSGGIGSASAINQPWQINQPIIIEFLNPLYQGDFQSLSFVPENHTPPPYADANGLISFTVPANDAGLTWQYQQTLSISPRIFYHSNVNTSAFRRRVVNLPFDSTYNVNIKFQDGINKVSKTLRILTFKTPSVEVFKKFSTHQIVRSETWQSKLTKTEQKNLDISRQQHEQESNQQSLRNFDGTGVKIAVQDDGIRQNSVASVRVGFRLQNVGDDLLGSRGQRGAVHGTLMSNFLMDYAPAVELFDFNVFPYVQHINQRLVDGFRSRGLRVYDYPALALMLGADLMNVSLVSPKLQRRDQFWISAIMKGLVISKSLGNDQRIKHDITQNDCTDPANFMPYFAEYLGADLTQAQGALVTLQAVVKTAQGYVSVRSQAGGAASYTLSILETQSGATSQAAATFSGIFALIKQAAQRYNRDYSNKQLVEILFETADDIGPEGVDAVYGHGLVNINQALKEIEKGYAPSVDLYENLDYVRVDQLDQLYQEGCTL